VINLIDSIHETGLQIATLRADVIPRLDLSDLSRDTWMKSLWVLITMLLVPQIRSEDAEVIAPTVHQPGAPDANVLGRCSWTLLHSVTMAYPTSPTLDQRRIMHNFFYTFAQVYPCSICAKHFQGLLQENPPNTESKATLARWLCETHNKVNERLKKPLFSCENVFTRWDAPSK
jgi:FAD-linked sulfhydryl oxidase